MFHWLERKLLSQTGAIVFESQFACDTYSRLVMTKADKVKASDLAVTVAATEAEARKRAAAHPEIIVTSSEGGMGIAELRAAVVEAIG